MKLRLPGAGRLLYSAPYRRREDLRGNTEMAAAPSNYKRGSMDIREQQATFGLFWGITKYGIVFCVLLLIVLAYMFT